MDLALILTIIFSCFGLVIGLVVFALIVIVIIASTKPKDFTVVRSATINASPEKIFPLINDFHNWISWSPWEKLDPEMKRTHAGSESGVGSIYEWEGNKKVGKGRMEITGSTPPARINIKLDFIKPFEAHNTTEFSLDGSGQSTKVTWTMHGNKPFLFKIMSLFMNMDKMIGSDFEKGLDAMKTVAET